MASKQETEKFTYFIMLMAVFILAGNFYCFLHPLLESVGLTLDFLDAAIMPNRQSWLYSDPFYSKFLVILLMSVSMLYYPGKPSEVGWPILVATGILGLLFYFFPFRSQVAYLVSTLVGLGLSVWTVSNLQHAQQPEDLNDEDETFRQCNRRIRTKDSINIPFKYQYRKKIHTGWINVVNPFRGSMVLGTPGSGKSFSIYEPFIEQMISRGYSLFVYDFKYPTLTEKVYNELLKNVRAYKVKPRFCVVDMNHPAYSFRCNPLNPRFIRDPADASEIAELIMLNVSKDDKEKEDFFSMSAKVILESAIWFLREYDGGRYCTFPHLIEFISQDYRDIIKILLRYPEIKARMRPFDNALSGNAQDQLQGQLASAQIPLAKFVSRSLYWTLSGDDVPLDINNPKRPVIFCVGNDPDRQMIYGTTLALITSRMFKTINRPKKNRCGVLLDELPTVYLRGIDNLIATARSNKVAVVIGAQDKSQIIKNYGEKESEVVFNTVGNILSGQVAGRTAEQLSRTFGKELRARKGYTYGVESQSTSVSNQETEVLPVSKIETLSQGVFFGKVADKHGARIKRKLFCGEIIRDVKRLQKEQEHWKPIPRMTTFGEDEIRRRVLEGGDEMARKCLRREWKRQGILYEPELIEGKMEEAFDSMTPGQKQELLEKYAEEDARRAEDHVLQENFMRIQRDVETIMMLEKQKIGSETLRNRDQRMNDPFDGV